MRKFLALAFLGWCLTIKALPQETQEVWYDDDTELTFIWTPPEEGSFDCYHVYVSVDGGDYQFDQKVETERAIIKAENGRVYRIKVAAANTAGQEGPFSPESDQVWCDTEAPPAPDIYWMNRLGNSRVALLLSPDSQIDKHFSHYQVRGGPGYPDWSDVAWTDVFFFKLFPGKVNVLEVRQIDRAGNVSQATLFLVEGYESQDLDGDGFSDEEELIFGTNPSDPQDFPQLFIQKASEKLRLCLKIEPRDAYRLEWSKDLKSWHDLGEIQLIAEGDIWFINFEPRWQEEKRRFFRIAVFPSD